MQQTLKHWKDLCLLALPIMLNNLIVPLSIAFITKLIAEYGPFAVAGFAVAARIESFISIPMFGISAGISPIIGQNFGAQKHDRVRDTLKYAHKSVAILIGVSSLILLIFSPNISNIFTNSKDIAQSCVLYFKYIAISYAFLAIYSNINSALVSVGKAKTAMALTAFRMLIVYIPMALLFKKIWQLDGIYIAQSLSNIAAALAGLYAAYVVFFRKGDTRLI